MEWVQEITRKVPDWNVIERAFPYSEPMRSCIQDPVHHAEGDVWTHTRMVFDQLSTFGYGDDVASRYAALFHDVSKPETRTVEHDEHLGREVVRHPSHARKGASVAWLSLYEAGLPLETRLEVYWLCQWHQRAFHMWSYDDMARLALSYASVADWKRLIAFARSDNAGRICSDPSIAETNLSLLLDWLEESDYLDRGRWSSASRMFYLEKEGRSPFFNAQEPTGSRVVIMSGLPGSGKDTHISNVLGDIPVISLDGIREEMDVDPSGNNGRVIQEGYERARVFLRSRKPFVWNTTGLTRKMRAMIIGLCRSYDAHVTIHALDRPFEEVLRQNRERERMVPEKIIRHLAAKWEPPSLLEAHEVHWV